MSSGIVVDTIPNSGAAALAETCSCTMSVGTCHAVHGSFVVVVPA
jgi:hypothetical protein